MTRLETRIRNIAAEMEDKYWGKYPHSIFVEWDRTWDVADDLGITETSSNEEIEAAIRHQEDINSYTEQMYNYIEPDDTPLTSYEKKCARELAKSFFCTIPDFQPMLPPYREVLKAAQRVIHEEARTHECRPNSEIPLMPATGYDYIGVDYYCDPYNDLGNLLVACLKKCLESTYDAYVQEKEIHG